jgi:hypothetical protein
MNGIQAKNPHPPDPPPICRLFAYSSGMFAHEDSFRIEVSPKIL